MTPSPQLQERLNRFPVTTVPVGPDVQAFRHSGGGASDGLRTVVVLHGIGSGSASWLAQLEAAAITQGVRLLAWDAPGYGASSALPVSAPNASDYAKRLWAWLDAMALDAPVCLVGHSLGALMAARAAVLQPDRVASLVLLSPAIGYARSNADERAKKRDDRLAMLERLGPDGMARERGAAMLSTRASADQLEQVQLAMSQIQPGGYRQATELLARGDLLSDVLAWQGPFTVASGSADTITPRAACESVATAYGETWIDLGPVGHVCAVETPEAVNTLLGLTTTH